MALDRFNENMDIIAGLGDDPKRDDGLSTPQFKSVFDKAGLLIQKFLNETLIPQIENFLDEGTVLGKITEALSRKLDKTGGTMEGSINMNGQRLYGLNKPTADNDAATKGFVVGQVKEAAPFNYSHNSNFEQWIAQAGIGGKHSETAYYAGDRWILDSGVVTGDAREDGNGYTNITLNGTIRQIVANAPDVGTAAIEMVSGTATIAYANGAITITSNGGVIRNVRLFKGKWNADNMAAYQPKGYGAELAECQRYFVRLQVTTSIHEHVLPGLVTSGATMLICSVYLPACMRINPTVTNSTMIIVRGINGYSTDTNSETVLANIAIYCLQGNVLSLIFTKQDGSPWGGITNNTPIAVEFEMNNPVDISADL